MSPPLDVPLEAFHKEPGGDMVLESEPGSKRADKNGHAVWSHRKRCVTGRTLDRQRGGRVEAFSGKLVRSPGHRLVGKATQLELILLVRASVSIRNMRSLNHGKLATGTARLPCNAPEWPGHLHERLRMPRCSPLSPPHMRDPPQCDEQLHFHYIPHARFV